MALSGTACTCVHIGPLLPSWAALQRQLSVQVVGMLLARAARRYSWVPVPAPTEEYNSDFYLGNHLPSTAICAYIGVFGLLAVLDVWGSGNFNGLFSESGDAGVLARVV